MAADKPGLKIIAEALSAAAVVASLVFVAVEVRETARQTELNTEALRVTAYQNLIGQIAQFNVARLDAGLAEVYGKMQGRTAQMDSLSPVEQEQAEAMLFLLLRHADMAYYQYELGLLSEDRLESALMPFLAGDRPMYRAFWESNKGNFVPGFQAYMASHMAGR